MNEKDHKQHSEINERSFRIYSKREYISKERYLIVLLKEKNNGTPPDDDSSSCPIKCK